MNQKEIKHLLYLEAKYEVIGEWVSSDELYLEVCVGMDDEDEMPDWVYDAIVDDVLDYRDLDGFGYGFAETF